MIKEILKTLKGYSDPAARINDRKFISETHYQIAAQKIDKLTKDHYLEFVEWLQKECEGFNSGWAWSDSTSDTTNIATFIFETSEEAYNHWLTEVKK